MAAAVRSARRLIHRALSRSSAALFSSLTFSSPSSRLQTPRAASAIQVFSRDCKSPSPAIQIGKKMTSRKRRGAP